MRWWRGLPWWVRRLIVPILVLLALWLGGGEVLRRRFEARIDELRARGVPIEPEQIMRPPAAPDENGAPLLSQMAGMADALDYPEALYTDEASWTPENRADLATWVEDLDPAYELLEEAARRPAFDSGLDWRHGARLGIPSIPALQQAAQFLDHRARQRGGADGVASLAVLMDVARKTERWTAINLIVRWACEQVAADTLQRLARRPDFDAAAAREAFDHRLAAAEAAVPASVRDAFLGERILLVIHIREWIDGRSPRSLAWAADDEGDLLDLFLGSWLARPFACRDGLAYLDQMDEIMPLLDQDPRVALPELERIGRAADNESLVVYFSDTTADLPARITGQRLRHVARLRLARIALALLEARQETGAWPPTLDAVAARLGGTVPPDPYTDGQPFAYDPGVELAADAPIPDPSEREWYEVVWRFR